MTAALLLVSVMALAYANGANDNFKGVATVYGSGLTSYRGALALGTLATFAGSLCSVFLASRIVQAFSGKGLVAPELAARPEFVTAVALGAAATVLLASRLGFPVSTTHALVGALLGAGGLAAGRSLAWGEFGRGFVLPLLVSPLIAVLLAGSANALVRAVSGPLGSWRGRCLCIGFTEASEDVVAFRDGAALPASGKLFARVAPIEQCSPMAVHGLRIRLDRVTDGLHLLSAGAVSFARGLNAGTPR